jgi:hypothetical protein
MAMSRSYRKFFSEETDEFDPPIWAKFRMKNRNGILAELYSVEYGEVVFPRYYGSEKSSWFSSARRYSSLKEIRDSYFSEINRILDDVNYEYPEYLSSFLEIFKLIREGTIAERYNKGFEYEWLNDKDVKKVIKKWEGDPLDVLLYLTRYGYIERAVDLETKRRNRK